jgi:hypothetical protein
MDEVIRRMGFPTSINASGKEVQSQAWEYILPDADTLVVRFVNGLVVAVEY